MDDREITSIISTSWGNLEAVFKNHCLIFLGQSKEKRNILDDFSAKLENEMEEYFAGKRKIFTIAANPFGSKFETDIWEACKKIPYGKTHTYKELSVASGHPKAFRACGNALHKNPIPFIIPCHRVLACNGIGGYGLGLDLKLKLLSLENPEIFSNLRQTS